MTTLNFTTTISASKQKVWRTLWEDKTFRDWSNIIDEGTYIKGELIEGQTIQFLSASGYGVTSLVAKLIPNQHITFKHMVDTKDSGNEKREDEWTGGTETYELEEINGTTTLTITTEVPDEMVEMFQERLPKALERIKELAEATNDPSNKTT